MTAAEAQVAVLLTLMRQLQEVMRTENGLLREHARSTRLQELQAEKSALAEAYELELRRLRQAPEAVASLSRREPQPAGSRNARVPGDGARQRRPAAAVAARVVEGIVRVIGESLGATEPRPARLRGPAAAGGRTGRGPGDPDGLRSPLLGGPDVAQRASCPTP